MRTAVRTVVCRAVQRRACSEPAAASSLMFNGTNSTRVSPHPEFLRKGGEFVVLQQLLPTGELAEGVEQPFSDADALRMYEIMSRSNVYDTVLQEAQRQGRISFYMTNIGEEAASVGSAAALKDQDLIWPQYRELCMFLWRGLTVKDVVASCIGNAECTGKGRNLPVHYLLPRETGVPSLPVKAPLATYVPQAPGAGYAFKLQKQDRCSVVYFGDGAASEGDTPSGFNFASVLGSQTIFVCRNNGFAISTPVSDQYAGDGIAARSVAFDIPSLRVDGNDVVAVYNATKAAREICIGERRPVLLELMTYRMGHHSSSDDSSLYRTEKDRQEAAGYSPIRRFRRFLTNKGLWDDAKEKELLAKARKDVLAELNRGAKINKLNPNHMFEDVFDQLTPVLEEQMAEMNRHVAEHRGKYKCELYQM